jgi:hypothetical protein
LTSTTFALFFPVFIFPLANFLNWSLRPENKQDYFPGNKQEYLPQNKPNYFQVVILFSFFFPVTLNT